jgi:hypothetical protein
MPHLLAITVQLRDLEALQAVCRRRGWEFRADQRHYRWFGRVLDDRPAPAGGGRCTHAIGVPGCLYEIGLLRCDDHFLPTWDDGPEGGLDRALGQGGGVLWQTYLAEAVRRAAGRHGQRVSRLLDTRGTLRLRVVTTGCQLIAHVVISGTGATSLLLFAEDDGGRYLAEALGTVCSETIIPFDSDLIGEPPCSVPSSMNGPTLRSC